MSVENIMSERDRNWKKVKQGLKSIVLEYAAWCFDRCGEWEPSEMVVEECRDYLNLNYPAWFEEAGAFGSERYQEMHNRFVATGSIIAAAEYRRTAKAIEDSYIEDLIFDFAEDAEAELDELARDYASDAAADEHWQRPL